MPMETSSVLANLPPAVSNRAALLDKAVPNGWIALDFRRPGEPAKVAGSKEILVLSIR
jgi:hypothetical protein